MIYFNLEEYCGIKMSKDGSNKLFDIMIEFIKISKQQFELSKPYFISSKLSEQKFSKKRLYSRGIGALNEAESRFRIAIQIAIILLEWKEKLKKLKIKIEDELEK